jgi:hypothetical protein
MHFMTVIIQGGILLLYSFSGSPYQQTEFANIYHVP